MLLEITGLEKRFGGVVAAKGLNLSVDAGEIVGLIGPNGSGKSTVMKLIMGLTRPDRGSIRLDGREIARLPAHRIARAGVGLVFQHSRPLHRQTVLDNIKLALLPDRLLRFRHQTETAERAAAIATRVGLGAVLDRFPATLPFADLRRMELARALARDPKLVLIDEPFAGLTEGEVADFSALIAGFRESGHGVLLVDHNVRGVAALVDRVVALYLGEKIAEGSAEQVTNDATVRRVYLGDGLHRAASRASAERPAALLDVRDVSVRYGRAVALDRVSLSVGSGECVSVVGLNGAGKTTLFNAISGLVPCDGAIAWDGATLAQRSPARIARDGIVQCPETRELFGALSVRENLELAGQRLPPGEMAAQLDFLYGLFPRLRDRQRQAARTMSGGEQQMLAISRALMGKPRLLILDEPTLGLAPVILEQISQAIDTLRRTTGITILLGEQNVTFALPHADVVYVLAHGRIVWQGAPGDFVADEFL